VRRAWFALALACACREPTEITVAVSTDVPCASVGASSITVGARADVDTRAPTTTSRSCGANGDLGALVIVPRAGDPSAEVAFDVVLGVGRDVETCNAAAPAKGCIVARRVLRFVPHTPLRVEVPLRASCDGVVCPADATCTNGVCVSSEISDPEGSCTGAGCGENVLTPPALPDGGTPPPAEAGTEAGPALDASLDVSSSTSPLVTYVRGGPGSLLPVVPSGLPCGVVSVPVDGISDGCEYFLAPGTHVTLQAQGQGSPATGWYGVCASGAATTLLNQCSFVMNGPTSAGVELVPK
jgi:hypothetical protein